VIDTAMLAAIPAYARVNRYNEVREAAALIRAAGRVYDSDQLAAVKNALIARVPLLGIMSQDHTVSD